MASTTLDSETPYIAVGDFESTSGPQTNKSSLKRKVLVGSVCLLGVALIVGLTVGFHDDKDHDSNNPSAVTASTENVHVICGGTVQGSSTSQKVACYPATTASDIQFNTQGEHTIEIPPPSIIPN